MDNANGVYVESTLLSTVEESAEVLFTGPATIYLVKAPGVNRSRRG